jgi:hypothetical protein
VRERGGLDRVPEALLDREPSGRQGVAALACAGRVRELGVRQVVREHVESVLGDAEPRELTRREAARRDEAVDGLEHGRLVAGERGGVDGGLRSRAAAVEHRPGEREAAAAAEARLAVAEGDRDRAEQAEVVEVQHDLGAGLPRGRERARAEQRVHVVDVDDRRPEVAHGGCDLPRPLPAREHRPRRAQLPRLRRVAEQRGVLDPGAVERGEL